jgi:hypothetical protein
MDGWLEECGSVLLLMVVFLMTALVGVIAAKLVFGLLAF